MVCRIVTASILLVSDEASIDPSDTSAEVRKLLHYQLLFCKRIALERDTKNLEDIKLVDEH